SVVFFLLGLLAAIDQNLSAVFDKIRSTEEMITVDQIIQNAQERGTIPGRIKIALRSPRVILDDVCVIVSRKEAKDADGRRTQFFDSKVQNIQVLWQRGTGDSEIHILKRAI